MFVRTYILGGFPGIYFAPEGSGSGSGGDSGGSAAGSGAGSGTGSDNTGNGNGETQNQNTGQDNGSTNAGSGKSDSGGSQSGKVTFTPEQQAELNRLVGQARTDGRNSAKREADTEQARKKGEFEKLYTDLNGEVETKYKPALALSERLSERLNSVIDSQIATWPDSLKKQDPGKDNVEERSKWVERSQDLAKELLATKKAPDGEHGSGSSGDGKDKGLGIPDYLRSRYVVPGGRREESTRK